MLISHHLLIVLVEVISKPEPNAGAAKVKRKRQFPYRKAADLEADISRVNCVPREANVPNERPFKQLCDCIWNEAWWSVRYEHITRPFDNSLSHAPKENEVCISGLVSCSDKYFIPEIRGVNDLVWLT